MPQSLGRVAPIALTGARVYPNPSDAPLLDATIVVGDGEIASVGNDDAAIPLHAPVLDCRGCTIIPGLWNAHVHFHERKWADAGAIPAAEVDDQLQELTRYGFTTVFDLSSRWENTRCLRERINSGDASGPRIFSTGEGLIPTGGTPPPDVFRTLGLMETTLLEVDGVESARAACENAARSRRRCDQTFSVVAVRGPDGARDDSRGGRSGASRAAARFRPSE